MKKAFFPRSRMELWEWNLLPLDTDAATCLKMMVKYVLGCSLKPL